MKPTDEQRRASALVLLEALDVFEAATLAVSAVTAAPNVRAMVETIPAEQLRAVVTALAVEAVWKMPAAVVDPRTDVEIISRQRQVRTWVQRLRLEVKWVAS